MRSRSHTTGDVEGIARSLERRGLAVPALLWLEGCRPLSRLMGQALLAWSPWLSALLPGETVDRWRRVCADPVLYGELLDRLEDGATGGDGPADAEPRRPVREGAP